MSTSSHLEDTSEARTQSASQVKSMPAELAMAHLLEENNLLQSMASPNQFYDVSCVLPLKYLTELDPDILNIVLNRYFPDEKARVFSRQMIRQLHHRETYSENFHDGVYLTGYHMYEVLITHTFYEHLDHLRSLPKNELYLAKVITEAQQCMLEPEIEDWADEELPATCKTFDDMLLNEVKAMLSKEEQQGTYESIVSVMTVTIAAHIAAGRTIDNMPFDEPFNLNPTFQHTMIAIATWHSKEVAPMLALKVAGDVLPQELVEMVSEYYTLFMAADRSVALCKSEVKANAMRRARDEDFRRLLAPSSEDEQE